MAIAIRDPRIDCTFSLRPAISSQSLFAAHNLYEYTFPFWHQWSQILIDLVFEEINVMFERYLRILLQCLYYGIKIIY